MINYILLDIIDLFSNEINFFNAFKDDSSLKLSNSS